MLVEIILYWSYSSSDAFGCRCFVMDVTNALLRRKLFVDREKTFFLCRDYEEADYALFLIFAFSAEAAAAAAADFISIFFLNTSAALDGTYYD